MLALPPPTPVLVTTLHIVALISRLSCLSLIPDAGIIVCSPMPGLFVWSTNVIVWRYSQVSRKGDRPEHCHLNISVTAVSRCIPPYKKLFLEMKRIMSACHCGGLLEMGRYH